MTTAASIKPKRRLLRFSLRTMLVLMLLVCVALGWKVQRARKQREVVAWILQSGGSVQYDHQLDDDGEGVPNAQVPGPKWLIELLGVDFFDDAVEISLTATEVSDVSTLAALTNVEGLALDGTQVSDLSPLAELARLEGLVVSGTPVTDVRPLGGMTNIKRLCLSRTPITDVTPLAGLTNLEFLDLQHTQVSDVRPFLGLKSLRHLFCSWATRRSAKWTTRCLRRRYRTATSAGARPLVTVHSSGFDDGPAVRYRPAVSFIHPF